MPARRDGESRSVDLSMTCGRSGRDSRSLRARIARDYAERHGVAVSPERVVKL